MPSKPGQTVLKPLKPPTVGHNGYLGFHPGKVEVITAGSALTGWDGTPARSMGVDTILETDVEIRMRDGARLYADIFRPKEPPEGKVPVILHWSPFGKRYGAFQFLPARPWQCGVRSCDVSGYEKFEALDPAAWCAKGYAIANIDTRGSGNSDGNMEIFGITEGEDGYDTCEWLAKQDWCNGSVGMAGNSQLAIAQYFIAATQPPSLKAIAPWEGLGDLYRDQFVRGGIFNMSNFEMIINWIMRGKGGIEDFEAIYDKHPLFNEYWETKRAEMSKIKIPIYLEGSDHSNLHTMGTLRAWFQVSSEQKWLRWSPWQEWHDLWVVHENQDELTRFFDRFLKNQKNGFEEDVPRVRMSAIRFGDASPAHYLTWPDFPHPQTDYKDLYLGPNGLLSVQATQPGNASYDACDASASATFTYTFDTKTQLIGLAKAQLFMSCDAHDDMCVYVRLRKLDKDGKTLVNVPYLKERWPVKRVADIRREDSLPLIMHPGSLGQLRASHRAVDPERTMHPQYPYHPHDREDKIPPGQIVELPIGIYHIGNEFEAGESIRLDVFGVNAPFPEFAAMSSKRSVDEGNKGRHVVHFGPDYPSRVILPFVPLIEPSKKVDL